MPAKSLRVLILENQSFQRVIAVRILRQLGCAQVHEAATADEAITLLERTGPVDVVVCDVRMDGMDGLEFIHRAAGGRLFGGVIISSGLRAEVRHAITQLVNRLDMAFLGDVGKPLHLGAMRDALGRVASRAAPALAAPDAIIEPDEADIRRGLSHKEFIAHYLPRCDVASGEIKGVDVLAGWNHPLHGLLTGPQFMAQVQRCGLLDDLLVLLLEQGLTLHRSLLLQGHDLRMSFPLAVTQLDDRGLTRRIKSLMQFHRSGGQGIAFELSVCDGQAPSAMQLENLIRLRMLGCSLGLANFGTADASFERLCQLPFSEVRLSSLFVSELEQLPRQRAVIRSSLTLTQNLGIAVTVTGVERAGQHLLLMDMGCTLGQGSYFSPVLDRDELLRRLENLSCVK